MPSILSTFLEETAGRQHGLVTRQQLLQAGLSASQVDHLLIEGRLVAHHPGVLRVVGAPVDRHQAVFAAVLAGGRDAAAARATAAEIHDLRGPHRTKAIHVLVPHDRRVAPSGAHVILHRSRTINTKQLAVVGGIPLTDMARTVCDLAIDHSTRVVREAASDALRRNGTTLAELHERLSFAGRIRGAGRLRAALASLAPEDAAARSEAEARSRRLFEEAGIPAPFVNWRLLDGDRIIAEIDLAWPDRRLAVEIDGWWWHMTPAQKCRDEARQNALTSRGWRVLRFSTSMIYDEPQQVVATVRRALAVSPLRGTSTP